MERECDAFIAPLQTIKNSYLEESIRGYKCNDCNKYVIRKLVLKKFNKKRLIETLRAKTEGKTSYHARKIANVSVRRVDELWKEYLRRSWKTNDTNRRMEKRISKKIL